MTDKPRIVIPPVPRSPRPVPEPVPEPDPTPEPAPELEPVTASIVQADVVEEPDPALRLERIARQHTPYFGSLAHRTGVACRECGYLHPCPTNRMAVDENVDDVWSKGQEAL